MTTKAWRWLLVPVTLLCAGLLWYSVPLHTLDVRLFYAPADVGSLLTELGPEGRATYLRVALVDLVFIALYALTVGSMVQALRARGTIKERGRNGLLGVGAALVSGDLAETLGALWALTHHPDSATAAATVAAVGTPLKWAAAVALTVGVVVALFAARTEVTPRASP